MTDAYYMTAEKRKALIGKTIAEIDVKVGDTFTTGFGITFTDGSSIFIESEGYEGVGVSITKDGPNMITTQDQGYQEKVWEEFKRSGVVVLGYSSFRTTTLRNLIFYREHDGNFMAGYGNEHGLVCEVCNIPREALEAIVPGLGIQWNGSSSAALHYPHFSTGKFSKSELDFIEDAFAKAGFDVTVNER